MRSLLPGVVGLRARGTWTRLSLTAGAAAGLAVAAAANGTTDLKRGDPAPPLVMQSIDGRRVDTGEMRGRMLLLLFGEAGQDRTHQACREIVSALEAKRLADQPIDWILILSKSSSIIDLDLDAIEIQPPPIIVHDEARSAFGAYKTLVVPTVVVVGRDGRVVHALASYTSRFGDIVFDALSVAVGSLSVEEFEQTLHPPTDASAELHARRRAGRLVHFADRLCQRGLDDMAETKYVEALELAPACAPRGWAWEICFCARGGSTRPSTSSSRCSPRSRNHPRRSWAGRSCRPTAEAPNWTTPRRSRTSSSSTTAPGPGPTSCWA